MQALLGVNMAPLSTVSSQRKSTRYDHEIEVEILHDGQQYTGKTKNLSIGGMFILTNAMLPFGARLRLRFSISTLKEAIEVNAQIRWLDNNTVSSENPIHLEDNDKNSEKAIYQENGPKTFGVGVQFEGLRAKQVWALNKYFDKINDDEQMKSSQQG